MRILILSQYFWPENFKINELTLEINKRYEVEVLTSIPNYPSGKVNKYFSKSPNKFSLYKNIKIHRCWQLSRGEGSKIRIFLNYLSFIIFSIFKGIFLKKKFDVIFIFLPSPIFTAISGIILSKIFKSKVCIWVLDIWPEILKDLNIIKSKFLIKILDLIINFIYKQSDLIFVQSKSFQRIIKKKIKQKSKIYVLKSWTDKIKIKKKENLIKKNSILYFGNMGYAQNLNNLIEAAKILIKKKLNFVIILIGGGRTYPFLKKKIASENLQKFIKIKNFMKPNLLGKYIQTSDFFFLSLRNGKGLNSTIPAKLQTYMKFSRPIIAASSGEVKNIIKKAKCGFVSKPDDVNQLVNNFQKAFKLNLKQKRKYGKNASLYSNKNFNKKIILKNFNETFSKLDK